MSTSEEKRELKRARTRAYVVMHREKFGYDPSDESARYWDRDTTLQYVFMNALRELLGLSPLPFSSRGKRKAA